MTYTLWTNAAATTSVSTLGMNATVDYNSSTALHLAMVDDTDAMKKKKFDYNFYIKGVALGGETLIGS